MRLPNPAPPAVPADSAKTAAKDTTPPPTADGQPAPKPYDKVILPTAKTRRGMFVTHWIADKLYFEIPKEALNQDMLLVGRYTKTQTPLGAFDGYGGDEFIERLLRWERRDNRVLLRVPRFDVTADSTLPVAQAVESANMSPIIAVFPVEAYGPDSAPVIEVTRLYTSNTPEFAAVGVDDKRSFLEKVLAFPDNIEVEATQTGMPMNPQPGAPPQVRSVIAHWSMVRLPKHPMLPRLADDRVGYFNTTQVDFGRAEQKSVTRTFITRWRLEKKDPNAAVSDPVEPIVYYIDPATPDQWKPWIKRGIEEWQPAFEAAGFSHAIVARDVPKNDPDWSPEDIRHTVVRWLPSTVENSVGPHVHDPRTGEILNGSVRMFHNILNLQRDWYFTQVASLDPRAQHLPFPDSLMGRLLQFVVAHEVGHTLGLPHNMKASSMYPADSVRSATWVHKMGHSPSIMDYARFNYVAQPEDHIALEDLVPRVGPYDRFSIMWGYSPVPTAKTSDDEKPTLDKWARMQDTVPWYRFSVNGERGTDPGEETEAVGDGDATKSTAAGLKNIRRIVPMLIPATITPGNNNDDLNEMYDRLVQQWSTEINHVVNVIGGSYAQEKGGSQPGARFTPLPRARQEAALRFLQENVFETPMYLLDRKVLARLEPYGAMSRIRSAQEGVLGGVLSDSRLQALIEYETMAGGDAKKAYPLRAMFHDLQSGIWRELARPKVTIDPFRRNLQAGYVQQMIAKIAPPSPAPMPFFMMMQSSAADIGALAREQLVELDAQVQGAIPRAANMETRAHLRAIHVKLDAVLNPNRR